MAVKINTVPKDDKEIFCHCGEHAGFVIFTNDCPTCGSEIKLCIYHTAEMVNDLMKEIEIYSHLIGGFK